MVPAPRAPRGDVARLRPPRRGLEKAPNASPDGYYYHHYCYSSEYSGFDEHYHYCNYDYDYDCQGWTGSGILGLRFILICSKSSGFKLTVFRSSAFSGLSGLEDVGTGSPVSGIRPSGKLLSIGGGVYGVGFCGYGSFQKPLHFGRGNWKRR